MSYITLPSATPPCRNTGCGGTKNVVTMLPHAVDFVKSSGCGTGTVASTGCGTVSLPTAMSLCEEPQRGFTATPRRGCGGCRPRRECCMMSTTTGSTLPTTIRSSAQIMAGVIIPTSRIGFDLNNPSVVEDGFTTYTPIVVLYTDPNIIQLNLTDFERLIYSSGIFISNVSPPSSTDWITIIDGSGNVSVRCMRSAQYMIGVTVAFHSITINPVIITLVKVDLNGSNNAVPGFSEGQDGVSGVINLMGSIFINSGELLYITLNHTGQNTNPISIDRAELIVTQM